MSRFSGKQHPGALRAHRDKLYHDALRRQEDNLWHGHYIRPIMAGSTIIGVHELPAPIERFLRKADQPPNVEREGQACHG